MHQIYILVYFSIPINKSIHMNIIQQNVDQLQKWTWSVLMVKQT